MLYVVVVSDRDFCVLLVAYLWYANYLPTISIGT